jgi:RNA polymerase sigma-70 factor, ECF subfamily
VPEPDRRDLTALLHAWHGGDEDAYRQLTAALYDELRRQALRHARRRRQGDSLPPTALVHEVFVRLAGAHQVEWQDRTHFLAVAARTMRRVVVDLARARRSAKRGADAPHLEVDSAIPAANPSTVDLMALDAALDALAALDPRKVQVIELRFFGGLTVEETAAALGVSADTVARDWRMARAWLLQRIG